MESDIKLEICFRFLELSKDQEEALKNANLGTAFGKHFITESTTGIIPLSENNISQIATFIKENNISIELTDVFISFVSEFDTRIIDIPELVNRSILQIGSKLVISYTIV